MHQASLRRRLAGGERALGTMMFEFFTPGLIPVLRNAGCEWVVVAMRSAYQQGFAVLREA